MNGNVFPVIALAASSRDRRTQRRVLEQALPVALGGPLAPTLVAVTAVDQQRGETRREEQLAREAATTVVTLAAKPVGQSLSDVELRAVAPRLTPLLDRLQLKTAVLSAQTGGVGPVTAGAPTTGSPVVAAQVSPQGVNPNVVLAQAIAPFIAQAFVQRFATQAPAVNQPQPAGPLAAAINAAVSQILAQVVGAVQQQVAQNLAQLAGAGQAAGAGQNAAQVQALDPALLQTLVGVFQALNRPPQGQMQAGLQNQTQGGVGGGGGVARKQGGAIRPAELADQPATQESTPAATGGSPPPSGTPRPQGKPRFEQGT